MSHQTADGKYNISSVFPSPDNVGTTEYLAVHGMMEGAGHINESDCFDDTMLVDADTARHMIDMLTELGNEALRRRRLLKEAMGT